MKAIAKTPKNTIVIDDAGYLITNFFMRGHSSAGSGNAIFGFYNKLADNFWNLIEYCKTLPDSKIVVFIMHEEKNENGDIRPKTIGRLIDEKVCLEGNFTIVLRSVFSNNKYVFRTQTDGFDVAKSPLGLFDDVEIDNDLKLVDRKIREFYDLGVKE